MTDISNTGNVLDVRDIIARVEELEAECNGEHDDSEENDVLDMRAELATLMAFLNEMKGYGGDENWRGDWYPVTLIHEDYFVSYCRELVEDIGDLPRGMPSYLAIDWDRTADNLRVDYSTAEFDGQTFLYR